jgi:hypothetical protein
MKKEFGMETKLFILFSIILTLTTTGKVIANSGTVAIIFDRSNLTYTFAATEMKNVMTMAGYTVSLENIKSLSTVITQNRIFILVRGSEEANNFINQASISPLPASSSQGYSVRKKVNKKSTDWYIIGYDKAGAMYGGLDFGESVLLNGFQGLGESDKKPYIVNRGIKFNIPLDARTPSYSDNSDAAQKNIANMWDINFWHEFLDDMAKDHFNMLSLWSLAPFPSMVNVPEYANAGLKDVKKTTAELSTFKTLIGDNMSNSNTLANLTTVKTITLDDKIKFWKEVMKYGSDRGIDFYLFNWNIFTYGTENSGYGFTTAVSDKLTKDYFRKATRALLTTYPLLKGLGITAGENIKANAEEKEIYLYDSYGQGINDALASDPSRTFSLIHRTIQTNANVMKSAFSGLNPRCKLEFSYKYSQAHVYSSVDPNYIHKDNFLKNIGNSGYYFTLRDDDWYYLRGGSDPAFVRSFIKNMPMDNLKGFYLGPDGYTWGREYISKNNDTPNQLIFNKRWYCFRIWGELAYDPTISDSRFAKILGARFPTVNAQKLYDAWAKASSVIPLVNRFHNIGCQMDYQWYPEMCNGSAGFHSVDKFITVAPQIGEGMMGIPEYADAVLNATKMTGTTPIQIAQNLLELGDQSLLLISGMTGSNKELVQTLKDIKAMALLGQYYSMKILGATDKCISDKTTDVTKKTQYGNEAIKNLKDASQCWAKYASQLSNAYIPQYLTRMQKIIDVKAIQSDVDKDILLVKKN